MNHNFFERQEMNVPAQYYGYPATNPVQAPQFPTQNGQYPPQAPAQQFPSQLQVPVPAGADIPNVGPVGPVPGMPLGVPGATPAAPPTDGLLPLEQSYIENILRFNRGKWAKVYQTFEYNPEWPAKVFHGVVQEAGRDHLILGNPETGQHYLLLMVNLDYVEFDEPIEYVTPTLPGYVQSTPVR
jgi:spore germination protein Q